MTRQCAGSMRREIVRSHGRGLSGGTAAATNVMNFRGFLFEKCLTLFFSFNNGPIRRA